MRPPVDEIKLPYSPMGRRAHCGRSNKKSVCRFGHTLLCPGSWATHYQRPAKKTRGVLWSPQPNEHDAYRDIMFMLTLCMTHIVPPIRTIAATAV
jgi:hypothetical protein